MAMLDVDTVLTRAIADPGRFTVRGDDYAESLVAWQVRAVRIALDMAGWTFHEVPMPDDEPADQDPFRMGHASI